jgi:hypothetical protein
MTTYSTSSGERFKKSVIDVKVKRAKATKLEEQLDEYGYNFCEVCHKSSGTYLDCSHDISVKTAQETGHTELAWDVNNITIRCRLCHQKHDNLV